MIVWKPHIGYENVFNPINHNILNRDHKHAAAAFHVICITFSAPPSKHLEFML